MLNDYTTKKGFFSVYRRNPDRIDVDRGKYGCCGIRFGMGFDTKYF